MGFNQLGLRSVQNNTYKQNYKKKIKNKTKKTVSEAKPKGRERKTRNLDQVKCVKDEDDKVLVHKKDIKDG